ncbi:MAG TPA: pyridoxal-phosphate dependent enzyme [Steroidobacteraceae bacterium]|nr:pyridoxal-phosphate dependent enzyme [Steroidobacteraceae bacterium]
MLQLAELDQLIAQLPRQRIGIYPTPFHKVENLSRLSGVNIFMKREDMAGPGTISGSKMRLAEFIIGRALREGVDTLITQGVYLTNSGMQFATAARVAGITPILYLTRAERQGAVGESRGNLLLSQIMGVETHYMMTSGAAYWNAPAEQDRIVAAMEAHKAELEGKGHKVIIVPTGGAHPYGFVAHALTFTEAVGQARALGVELDYFYHTAGTGTALPGMVAAKLLTGHGAQFRSIAINSYQTQWMNRHVIVERVKQVFQALNVRTPASDEEILDELDVDERFIGQDYAVPSAEGAAAIKRLAMSDGVFLGPVYTAKGFAGLLDDVRTGRIEPGSNVVFVHTGDTANLFERSEVVGEVAHC